jgi:hypothetical protein
LKLQVACGARGIDFEFQDLSGVPLVTYARNELVGRFLDQANATHLMFIDADVGFEPDQVFRLLDFGGDVVAGVYPRKLIDWDRVERAVKRGRPPESAALDYFVGWWDHGPQDIGDGFVKVHFVGAGFLMIRRQVVMRLADAHPELRYQRANTDPPAFSYGLFENLMLHPTTVSLGGWARTT